MYVDFCFESFDLLTLSALGGAGPSIAWGGQFDPHILTAPGGLLGHKSSNFNHYTFQGEDK